MNVKGYTKDDFNIDLILEIQDSVGQGTFGKVFKGTVAKGNDDMSAKELIEVEIVAIKQISIKSSHCERELKILKILDHPNILTYKYHYYSVEQEEKYLNIISDYISNNLYSLYRSYLTIKGFVPVLFVKMIVYQLLRGLAYLHFKGICHRDIKPLNLLVQSPKHILKIGDFGSAKKMIEGETNISYICSRYYRAPELIFGSTSYSFSIDVWSSGCVLAELMVGKPLFVAKNSIDLICEMTKILGTPTRTDFEEINPAFTNYPFPKIPESDIYKIFSERNDSKLIDLLVNMLKFSPSKRIDAKSALLFPCFVDLVKDAAKFISEGHNNVPDFVNFTPEELAFFPEYSQLKLAFDQQSLSFVNKS